MDFLLVSLGSHGDVHPFVGLGVRLQQRGHRVRLIANQYFQTLIESAGLDFIELGKTEEFLQLASDPDMWNPRRAFWLLFGTIGKTLEKQYNVIADNVDDGTIVASSSLSLAARIAEDKLGFAHATVHLAPSLFRTVHDTPKIPGLYMPRWFPDWVKRAVWAFGDTWIIDRVIAPPANALRAKLGLPPVKCFLRDWWHAPRLTIGMFPDWFALPQPDWPSQLRLSGFPLYDEREIVPISDRLEEFLVAGEPPVAFTPGSAMFDGEAFFAAAVHACERMKTRGILLTRHREQLPARLPDNVIHVDFSPFSLLLPRVAAIVHHGGIGTSSQGLAAGVPALVMPMCYDQLDNAERLRRLGVAEILRRRRFTPRNIAAALRRLIGSESVRQSAREAAEKVGRTDGLGTTCDLLESLSPRRISAAPRTIPAGSLRSP